jgi:hypothetical protein
MFVLIVYKYLMVINNNRNTVKCKIIFEKRKKKG